jgi:hypothetical protein
VKHGQRVHGGPGKGGLPRSNQGHPPVIRRPGTHVSGWERSASLIYSRTAAVIRKRPDSGSAARTAAPVAKLIGAHSILSFRPWFGTQLGSKRS